MLVCVSITCKPLRTFMCILQVDRRGPAHHWPLADRLNPGTMGATTTVEAACELQVAQPRLRQLGRCPRRRRRGQPEPAVTRARALAVDGPSGPGPGPGKLLGKTQDHGPAARWPRPEAAGATEPRPAPPPAPTAPDSDSDPQWPLSHSESPPPHEDSVEGTIRQRTGLRTCPSAY